MSTNDTYLAVFTSNKTSPRWRAWYAMSDDERRVKDEEGLAALKAWDEAHQDAIVYEGGPLGPTKRTSLDGVADVVNPVKTACHPGTCCRDPAIHERRSKLRDGSRAQGPG